MCIKFKSINSMLMGILFFTACTTSPVATSTQGTTPQAEVNTLVEKRTLTVLAAASLTESFQELGTLFETEHEGVNISFNFAGSQALAEQLGQGAPADVFASANTKYIQVAVEKGQVDPDTVRTFAYNRLVIIYPKENQAGISAIKDLAKTGIKIDLADASVPVGQYALEFLEKASADAKYGQNFKDTVLQNVVSYEENVKAVVTKVSLNEADAGIVYCTDVTPDVANLVGTINIPDELNTIATYPIAPIIDSKNAELAQAFVDLVLSREGQAILGKYGFQAVVDN